MAFVKYQHVEKLCSTEVQGIEEGKCYVFPKIDGTNSSIWSEDDDGSSICFGSRNRQLSLDKDNQGFMAWASEQESIKKFFSDNPFFRLYGEWLVPHSLKTYREGAWRQFYVFDVCYEEDGVLRYMPYDKYSEILDLYGIEYIPPLFCIECPSRERLMESVQLNNYLIKDGEGVGEGVVIKNYDFVNRFGRTIWAKVVTSEFKDKHRKAMPTEITEKTFVEDEIVAEFVTKALVDKVYANICNLEGEWHNRLIPRLLNTVFYDLVREETWAFINRKKAKNPKIDFGELQKATFRMVKQLLPEVF